MPGHSQAAIAAYPELGNTDVVDTAALDVWDAWGVSPNVLAPTDDTLRFYEDVLEEVLDLFPVPRRSSTSAATSAPRTSGGRRPRPGADRAELGLADEDELQAWFIRALRPAGSPRAGAASSAGTRSWRAALAAEGAAVSSWRGYAGGIAAAEAGHDVVMCPEHHVYLDHRQDGGPTSRSVGYVRTLERRVPLRARCRRSCAGGGGRHVLGGQANMWTEDIENPQRVDYQAFPRLAAFAEVAWSRLPAPGRAGLRRLRAADDRALRASRRPRRRLPAARRAAAVAAAPRRARPPDRGGATDRVTHLPRSGRGNRRSRTNKLKSGNSCAG